MTFGKVKESAESVAVNLMMQGYSKDSLLTICMNNCIEQLLMVFAVWRLGGKVALMNHLLSESKISLSVCFYIEPSVTEF